MSEEPDGQAPADRRAMAIIFIGIGVTLIVSTAPLFVICTLFLLTMADGGVSISKLIRYGAPLAGGLIPIGGGAALIHVGTNRLQGRASKELERPADRKTAGPDDARRPAR